MRVLFLIRDMAAAEPLGVMYISAMLKANGHETQLSGTRGIDLLKLVTSYQPDTIGYSLCTGNHTYYLKLNRWLKQHHDFVSLFGGPHPTFYPNMIEEDGVDIICQGEGEYPTLDLCERLSRQESIINIPNLWIKQNGHIHQNKPRTLTQNLDDLPIPDREARYACDERHREYAAKSFITNRGCPFYCSYCFNPSFTQLYGSEWRKRRFHSPERIVQEIVETAAATPLKFVQFRCSIFPNQIEWLERFVPLYKAQVGLPFYAHVRADLLNRDNIRLMAQAGCYSVNMGIECGDEDFRKTVMHRPMSNDQIRQTCKLLHEFDIKILADNILGLPGQTLETDLKTFRLNVECKIDYPLAMLLQPYPGTEIGQYCIDNGHFDQDYNAINSNYYYKSPLKFKDEREKCRIENFQKLFSITSEVPWAVGIVKRLCHLPQNVFFYSVFRVWYAYCYHTRIMPFKLSRTDLKETMTSLFGIYEKDGYNG